MKNLSFSRTGFQPKEVFLSHDARDKVFTRKLAAELSRHGIPIWFSSENILGSQQWHDQIGAALRRRDWIVVVLSPNSVRSQWVKYELLYALNHSTLKDRLVPVLYKPCNADELSWVLRAIQIVDLQRNWGKGLQSLLRIWGVGYVGPSIHPTIRSRAS
jgi:hypothetical protein